MVLALLAGGLFGARPAAAANGFSISSGQSSVSVPWMAANAAGTKTCVTWNTSTDDDAFIRLFDIPSNSWSPALSEPAVNLSNNKSEGTSTVRCAFDGAGRVHATWTEGNNPNQRIEHRYLPAGAANTAANWSAKAEISPRGVAQHAAVAAQLSDATGKVWAVYVDASGGGRYDIAARVWTPNSGWADGGQVTDWSDTTTSHYPFVAVDDAGYVHVAYGQGGTRYAYRDAASGAWVGRVGVPGAAGAQRGVGLAVNRTSGDVHIAFANYAGAPGGPRVVGYAKKTGSVGTSFTPAGTNMVGDQYFTVRLALSGNKVIVAADGASGTGRAIGYAVSDNGGASFGGQTVLTSGVNTKELGLAADGNGNAYFAYQNISAGDIYFSSTTAVSAPGGGSPPPPPPTPAGCGEYSCWASRGGILTDSPAAATFGGKAYVFAKGSDNGLYVKSTTDGKTFSNWIALGGLLTDAPAAASYKGRLYVFAKGSDNALYVKSSSNGVNFTDWTRLGGVLTAAPAAASAGDGLYVFAKGSDSGLYLKRSTNGATFGDWQPLGGLLTAAPAAAGFGGSVYVYAKGSDNGLYVRKLTNGRPVGDWVALGGVLTAAPAAAVADGKVYVFANGSDSGLYYKASTNGLNYGDWSALGGALQAGSTPAAAGVGSRVFAFVWWSDGALWERHAPK